jgi:hypothetical protein
MAIARFTVTNSPSIFTYSFSVFLPMRIVVGTPPDVGLVGGVGGVADCNAGAAGAAGIAGAGIAGAGIAGVGIAGAAGAVVVEVEVVSDCDAVMEGVEVIATPGVAVPVPPRLHLLVPFLVGITFCSENI